jgi:hypothetical protein
MLEDVGKKLKVKTLEDWYKTTQKEILKHAGTETRLRQVENINFLTLENFSLRRR